MCPSRKARGERTSQKMETHKTSEGSVGNSSKTANVREGAGEGAKNSGGQQGAGWALGKTVLNCRAPYETIVSDCNASLQGNIERGSLERGGSQKGRTMRKRTKARIGKGTGISFKGMSQQGGGIYGS